MKVRHYAQAHSRAYTKQGKLRAGFWQNFQQLGHKEGPQCYSTIELQVSLGSIRDGVGSIRYAAGLPRSVDYHGGVGDVDLLVDYDRRLFFGRRLFEERVVV